MFRSNVIACFADQPETPPGYRVNWLMPRDSDL